MSTTAPATKTQREVTVTRQLDAPRQLVWDAWVTPEQFAHWFGAELEIPMDTVSMDVREGGRWKATMLQDGRELPFGGEYLELVEPERIVMTFDDAGNVGGGITDVQTLTVTFTDLGADRTELVLVQAGLMDEQMPAGLTHGYNAFIDRLAQLLATR